MKKIGLVLLCFIIVCFLALNCYATGATHHNDNYYDSSTTNNYEYNNYNDMDYNYDVDNDYQYNYGETSYNTLTTNNYDNTVDNTSITNITNNIDNTTLMNELNHANIHREADTLFNIRITDNVYGGVSLLPQSPDPNILYVTSSKLYFNPAQVVAKLGPNEFSQFNINVTSDRPIILSLSSNRSNIKVISPNIVINRNNGTALAVVMVSLEKGMYWSDGFIYFKSITGETLGKIRIVFENKLAIDHISRIITDTNYTTIGHGIRQNRGTWGWEAFAAVKIDRNTNEETVYGVFTYDW